jgi:hypothetical protein
MNTITLALIMTALSSLAIATPTTRPVAKADRLDNVRVWLQAFADMESPDVKRLQPIVDSLGDDFDAGRKLKLATDVADAKRIVGDLAFVPTDEAPVPQGWPRFTPVGETELKTYPAYRMAVVRSDGKQPDGVMFWKLFGHIQRNDIAMTAPVEMTMTGQAGSMKMVQMGFLYESQQQGAAGPDRNDVEVIDIAAMTALSTGRRGEVSWREADDARKHFELWLSQNPEYVSAGELRILGYNSPSMPDGRKFYEIQLPVKQKD